MRETSINAYRQIKADGLLSKARLDVYEILYDHGPMTAGEVFQIMRKERIGHSVVKGSVCARLTELNQMGCVNERPTRECKLTGKTAIVWALTNGLPQKVVRPKSKDQIIEELTRDNDELEEKVGYLTKYLKKAIRLVEKLDAKKVNFILMDVQGYFPKFEYKRK